MSINHTAATSINYTISTIGSMPWFYPAMWILAPKNTLMLQKHKFTLVTYAGTFSSTPTISLGSPWRFMTTIYQQFGTGRQLPLSRGDIKNKITAKSVFKVFSSGFHNSIRSLLCTCSVFVLLKSKNADRSPTGFRDCFFSFLLSFFKHYRKLRSMNRKLLHGAPTSQEHFSVSLWSSTNVKISRYSQSWS
jgi:hypothetical protein